jgi:ABC-2 type transport system ATP-binding protein
MTEPAARQAAEARQADPAGSSERPMVEIRGLRKRFGQFEALRSVDLTIRRGTVFGFIGPNGAGKSTTMAILATLLPPDEGVVRVDGIDVNEDPEAVRRRIGYMPDFFGVYDQFRTTEYLHFYGASCGIPKAEREAIIPQLLELVNLADKKDAYVDTLSRGMKQRLCLARCLVHDPDLLILDEPASGLDPRARIEMREILKELRSMGKTIIISSHILPELAEMVDEIGVIEQGRLIAQGSVAEIQHRLRSGRILELRLAGRAEEAVGLLEGEPHVGRVMREGQLVRFQFAGGDEEQAELLVRLVGLGFRPIAFSEAQTNLEDVFLEMTKGIGVEA